MISLVKHCLQFINVIEIFLLVVPSSARDLIKGNTDTYLYCTTIITHFSSYFINFIKILKSFIIVFKYKCNLVINKK